MSTRPKISSMYDETNYGPESNKKPGKTMAQQQFQAECDINNIMKKFAATGSLTHVQSMEAQYGDFSNVGNYQQAHEAVMAAKDSFMNLPAQIRKEFDNDPVKLMTFLQDDKNRKRAEEIGLIAAKLPSAEDLQVLTPAQAATPPPVTPQK